MVVESIIHHWVTVVAEIEEGTERLGISIWDLAAYFYAENGLIASTQTERLQREFAILTCLFDQVGLRTSTQKMVSMSCQPCHTTIMMPVEANERKMAVTGPKCWERQWRRVKCPEC